MNEFDIIKKSILGTTANYPRHWKIKCREEANYRSSIIAHLRSEKKDEEADKAKAELGIMLRNWQKKIWPTILPRLDQRQDHDLDQHIEYCYKKAGFITLTDEREKK